MAFSLEHSWVWDFWLADDGQQFHMFYLFASRDLGDPDLRHRNARIGHATSRDLIEWTDHGVVLGPGDVGDIDATATWTGSVVRGADGLWRMFYTGARFVAADSNRNIESVGLATSTDLFTWYKQPAFALHAEPRWYETLGSSTWPEEAWRDPWVFSGPEGKWHMLLTARANRGDDAGRGVIGHAVSDDLEHWEVRPPLSAPHQGFGHLEVPQTVEIDGHYVLLFSCNSPRLCDTRARQIGGIWVAPADSPVGPFDLERASLLVSEELYAGRLVRSRDGRWVLLAFEMGQPGGPVPGRICDPIPVHWDDSGATVVADRGDNS